MPTPKPDTSPANVARVLRDVLAEPNAMNAYTAERTGEIIDYTPAEIEGNALADALEQQAAAPTWEERVERLARHLEATSVRIHWGDNWESRNRAEFDKRAAAALHVAFPELAPSDA